jgi:hypothetical protein
MNEKSHSVRSSVFIISVILLASFLAVFSREAMGQIRSNITNSSADERSKDLNAGQKIKVLELRDYLLRPGRREEFIDLFEANFTRSQNILGGFTLGQYRVKGADDNFLWMRGFRDMAERYKFLNEFYYHSPSWKANKGAANSMLLNNDNVHLLMPVSLREGAETGFYSDWFGRRKGVAVIDLYTSNTKRDKLIQFMQNKYEPLWDAEDKQNTSLWECEPALNDFPALPVFQDKNILVRITFYKNESDYKAKMKRIAARMNDELTTEMADLVTLKSTLILYPTARSFSIDSK